MVCTAKYENVKNSDLKLVSISNNINNQKGFKGEIYPKLIPNFSLDDIKIENTSAISDIEIKNQYIRKYWTNILSKLEPYEVIKDLAYSIIVSDENNNEFSDRHIIAAWFELLLNQEVLEVKADEEDAKELEKPAYIKDMLEDVIKENIDMKGFHSLQAFYLYESGLVYQEEAKYRQEAGNQSLADYFSELAEEYFYQAKELDKQYITKKRTR